MNQLIKAIVMECWRLFVEASPFLLFGFLIAGLLQTFLTTQTLARHLGRNDLKAVLKAAIFGMPLPLCSCGVIPAAVGLRQQGAGRGPSAAFLVSVPETGVDSIAITYALLDPLMTVLRPVSALITAVVTGSCINRLPPQSQATPPSTEDVSCSCDATGSPPGPPPSLGHRLQAGLSYAFGELLRDIGRWLLLGILVAGILSALLPEDFFLRYLHQEWLSLLLMLVAGIPLYICASASTPVAAALVLKGLSPGAALVLLLVGPATNAATLTVVLRFWGRRVAAVYLASIAGCGLLLGWLTNRLYAWLELDISRWVSQRPAAEEQLWLVVSALLLAGLLIRALVAPKVSAKR